MTKFEVPVCRCGVYMHLHPTSQCDLRRKARWWHQHYLHRHIAVRIWWSLSDKARWAIAHRMASDKRDWCDLVDSVIAAGQDRRGDCYDDLCDVPLPTDARPVVPGRCYCSPSTRIKEMSA